MAPQQTAKVRTAFYGQFFLLVRGRIASPIMHRFGRFSSPTVRGLDVLYKSLNVS